MKTQLNISRISKIVKTALMYLNNDLTDIELIIIMNSLCSMKNKDQDLLMFKGIWSDLTDIEEEIMKCATSQEELSEFLDKERSLMRIACNNLIQRYQNG